MSQVSKLWYRCMDAKSKEIRLLREAMEVHRNVLSQVYVGSNTIARKKHKSRRKKDVLEACVVKEGCWLRFVKDGLIRCEGGKSMWDLWWSRSNFDMMRLVPSESADGSQDKREAIPLSWAGEIEMIIWLKLSVEWMQRVCEKRMHDVPYVVSDDFKRHIQNQQVRDVHIGNSNKLRTYAVFRQLSRGGLLEMAEYLRLIQNVKERLLFTRFRVGVLALGVETAR